MLPQQSKSRQLLSMPRSVVGPYADKRRRLAGAAKTEAPRADIVPVATTCFELAAWI